jgi:hypothetical protein
MYPYWVEQSRSSVYQKLEQKKEFLCDVKEAYHIWLPYSVPDRKKTVGVDKKEFS